MNFIEYLWFIFSYYGSAGVAFNIIIMTGLQLFLIVILRVRVQLKYLQ